MSEKNSFWSTLPGILTGIAGLLTAVAGLLGILIQIGVIDLTTHKNPPLSPIEQNLSGLWTGYHVITGDSGRPITSPDIPIHLLNRTGTYMFFKPTGSTIVVLQSSFGKGCPWEGKRLRDCEHSGGVLIDGNNLRWEYTRLDNRTTVKAKIIGEQIQGSYESTWSSGRRMWGEFILLKDSSPDEQLKSIFK